MNDHRQSQRTGCEPFASILAALDFDASETPATSAARAHLATCLSCQADQRAYARLDSALRASYGAATEAPFATADLLAAIGATSAMRPRHAGDPIRSVLYLRDVDTDIDTVEGYPVMRDTKDLISDPATPTRRTPPPGQRGRLRGQALTLGFSALAVAVVLIVATVSIFGPHLRHMASRPVNGSPTITAVPATTAAVPTGSGGALTAISMDSPTDGWALGAATTTPPPNPTGGSVALYHFTGNEWRLAQRISGYTSYISAPITLRMLSATDGWAYAGDNTAPLHYDGTSWKPAPIVLAGQEHIVALVGFDMTSTTEGWAAAYLTGGAAGPGAIGFLHYHDKQWMVDIGVMFAPSNITVSRTRITGFAALPGGEVWAVGSAVGLPSSQSTQWNSGRVGLIFHRYGGVWSVYRELNQPTDSTLLIPHDIVMLSATSGWIVGESTVATTSATGANVVASPLLLQFSVDADGVPYWSPVPSPVLFTGGDAAFTQVVANGANDVWISVVGPAADSNVSGVSVTAALLLHYNGSSWAQVKPNVPISGVDRAFIGRIGLTTDDQLWEVGGTETKIGSQTVDGPLLWRYHDGVWGDATVVSK